MSNPDAVDFRELLKKYIAHVSVSEGTDHIATGRTQTSVTFTDEERLVLNELSEAAEYEAALHADFSPLEPPTVTTHVTPNLVALFQLIAAYLRRTGPVQLEFRDGDKVISTGQDEFLRHLAARVLVLSDTVLTDTEARAIWEAAAGPAGLVHPEGDADIQWSRFPGDMRKALVKLAKGEPNA